jgi:hypothetical protein
MPSKASVSSAVWSSRFAKSDSAVVVIKNSSPIELAGQSVMAQASSIPTLGSRRLKTAGKNAEFQRDMLAINPHRALFSNQKPQFCALSAICS